jgi:hypothetical protein
VPARQVVAHLTAAAAAAAAAAATAAAAASLAAPQAAVEVRKQVNQLDNLTTSKAVDALLNAETVALFGNRQLEVRGGLDSCEGAAVAPARLRRGAVLSSARTRAGKAQQARGCTGALSRARRHPHTAPHTPRRATQVNQYDTYLRGYQAAAIQTERLAALLNAGQAVILSAGLTCVMVAAVLWGPAVEAAEAALAAAAGSGAGNVAAAAVAGLRAAGSSGGVSAGDLVLLQGLLLQVCACVCVCVRVCVCGWDGPLLPACAAMDLAA